MFEFFNKIAECDALKRELDSLRPLSPAATQQLKEYYKIGLTYTSNAVEGNSLTESETKVVIEDGLTIGGKPLRDHLEAIGHAQAYDFVYRLASDTSKISAEQIKQIHHLFYEKIDEDNAGQYRREKVFVSGTAYLFPSPDQVPGLMQNFVAAISDQEKQLHPIEFAAWLHLKFVTIHPFIDGNGRVARLLMNLVLLRAGYAVTVIPPVVRPDYIEILSSCQKSGQDQLFYDFISNMVWEALREQLRLIRGKS